MKVNVNQLKVVGKVAGRIGKAIVIEGTKMVAIKSVTAVINTGFEDGFGKIKNLKLDDYLKGGTEEQRSRGLFGNMKKNKKQKKDVIIEADDVTIVVDEVGDIVEDVVTEVVEEV